MNKISQQRQQRRPSRPGPDGGAPGQSGAPPPGPAGLAGATLPQLWCFIHWMCVFINNYTFLLYVSFVAGSGGRWW